VNYQLRIHEQKREAVAAFKRLNYHVVAAGDSFNDTAMLKEANVGPAFPRTGRGKKAIPTIQSRGNLRRFDEADQTSFGLSHRFSQIKHRLKIKRGLIRVQSVFHLWLI